MVYWLRLGHERVVVPAWTLMAVVAAGVAVVGCWRLISERVCGTGLHDNQVDVHQKTPTVCSHVKRKDTDLRGGGVCGHRINRKMG